MDLSFVLHKLENFSSNPGKLHFEGLVHLLRYIRENKTLGLKSYAFMNDAPLYDLLRQDRIINENQLLAFSDYSWQYCPETGRIIGACIIFYQGEKIDHCTHVTGPVNQSSAEREYNAACTTGTDLANFRMLIN